MQHASTEPFIVGREDDTPAQAAARHQWDLVPNKGHRRTRSSVMARGKAGLYRIVPSLTGCKAYPVAS